jgi:catechol 2,3-dioxygenase-like lactoylglutathione lyase family enzyme
MLPTETRETVSDTTRPREVSMSSTDTSTEGPAVGTIDMNLEVVTVPVSDVDRAKAFYQSLGWRLDIDLKVSDDVRNVQFTPPHSGCSIHLGKGLTEMKPGSLDRVILAVKDIEAARADLMSRGVDVSEVSNRRPPGFDSPGNSYFLYASFEDPDGNGWLMQEITDRLPGREWED